MDDQSESTADTDAKYPCEKCQDAFPRKYGLNTHLITTHGEQPPELTLALGGIVRAFRILPEEDEREDLVNFFKNVEPQLEKILSRAGSVKWSFDLEVTFDNSTNPEERTSSFESGTKTHLIDSCGVRDELTYEIDRLREKIDEYVSSGSGWVLKRIDKLELKYATYMPLSNVSSTPKPGELSLKKTRGTLTTNADKLELNHIKPSSGCSYIPTPRELASKKAIVNIESKDGKCFIWHVLAGLYPVKSNPGRVSHYLRHEKELDVTNVKFPIDERGISRFEQNNKISINIFGYDKEVFPLRISRERDLKRHVDLLLLKSERKTHYCLIKDLGKLVVSKITKHKGRLFICRFCLQHFSSQQILNSHLEMCSKHEVQKISMPSSKDVIFFKNHEYTAIVPFVIYFDFECLVLPSKRDGNQEHEPCAYCFVVLDQEGRLFRNQIHAYRGPNPISHFLESVTAKAKELIPLLTRKKMINMTSEDEENFRQAKTCALCKRPLGEDRVRDHCHFTGKYRRALHSACNLAYTKPKHIPVIAHNLERYDGHLIMQQVGKFPWKVECIPRTMETYLSFSIGLPEQIKLRFIDSLQFLNGSLEKCVQTVTNSKWSFSILKSQFKPHEVLLLTRKGVFPYEYLNSWERLKETGLPPLDSFYSSLTLQNITQEDYGHAQEVWKTFEVTTLGDYLDLYVKTDVLLLAEVFQYFRKICHENFKLDPAHFFSTPGLSWQAFLKHTEVELQPITDIDMHLFIESEIRGGIASVGNIRYAKANDPRSPDFDNSKPPSCILYLDKNNLYGGALSEPMPKSNFRFLSKEEIDDFDLENIKPNMGYILRVDLDYPENLHDSHNMYPMAPEKIPITSDMLSPSSVKRCAKTTTKLVPNLRNKRNYVCHYRNLRFYIKHGLRLVRIHAALEFKEENYIRPYVSFNTEKRTESKLDSERDFYKLCNNALFGKTLENVRKRIRVELTNNKKRALKLVNSPAFKSFRIFDNNLVAINSHFKKIILNKPIYIGFTVLELSKLFMYEFLYEKMLPIFGNRLNLLMTDTDSFLFHIQSEDALREIKDRLSGEFDLSNFPSDHFAHSEENKGVVNKMKVVYPTEVISEVVALRPKMYSILFAVSGREKKVAKGVPSPVTEHFLRHSEYKAALDNYKETTHSLWRVRSSKHHIASKNVKKKTLSPFDDKRFYPDDEGIRSLAHYHYRACPAYSSNREAL